MSYFDGNYTFRGQPYNVHISLPMTRADSSDQVTEGSAKGIWVGRDIHITMEGDRRGSPRNARIWFTNTGWDRSFGDEKVPAGGEEWLLENSARILRDSGVGGVIVGRAAPRRGRRRRLDRRPSPTCRGTSRSSTGRR